MKADKLVTDKLVTDKLVTIPFITYSGSLLNQLWTELHTASLAKPQISVAQKQENNLFDSIPKPIREWIHNNPMHLQCYNLLVGGRNYCIHFYCQEANQNLNTHIQLINTWLTVASKYANRRCSKHVNVYLYLTPLKKHLPTSKQQDISEEHANTAFTTSCAPETEIVLFREEEWFKVFIHESFHNLGLDFSEHYEKSKGRQLLASMFHIKSKFKLFEVYCEMWAEIINVLIKTPINKINNALHLERKFSLFQAAKILDFYGLNYEDIFESDTKYNENTEVFCYYVLKSLLMYNLNTFLEWIDREQSGSLQFCPNNVEKFIKELIVPFYKQDDYINAINNTQTYFDVPRKTFIGTTMRMSALQ